MKKWKNVIAGILVLVSTSSTICYASESLILGKYTMTQAAKLAGVETEDLANYRSIAGENFESEVQRLIDSASTTIPLDARSIKAIPGGLTELRNRTYRGDIHVTADNVTVGYRHGHAALAVDARYNLETLGKGNQSVVRNNSGWENHNSYALVTVKSSSLSSSAIDKAVGYGENNLTGIPYNALSGWGDKKTVNCASLVMRAFKEGANFTFTNSHPTAVSLPREFVESRYTNTKYTYNMPWS